MSSEASKDSKTVVDAPAPPPAGTVDAATREYVVLAADYYGMDPNGEGYERFVIVGRVEAATDLKAREQVGKTLPEEERDVALVAVPARYWKPKARKVTTKTVESWG